MINQIKKSIRFSLYEPFLWVKGNFAPPSPFFVKKKVLLRHAAKKGVWIETGTYLGDTSNFLSKNFSHVYTMEPSEELYLICKSRFQKESKVTVIHGSSEDVMRPLLKSLRGDVNFWLDGHFSSGKTFQGEINTPIEKELAFIKEIMKNFTKIVIFIDDVREFGRAKDYPSLDFLVAWSKENGFFWSIEHDIFIATKV